MKNTPLSGFAAARCGQGDAALAAGRPLLGCHDLGAWPFHAPRPGLLSRFPLSQRCALRAGGRSHRVGAALARLPWLRPRQFHAQRHGLLT